MYNELVGQISHHLSKGEPFAVAQVIYREAPSSGKPGDKAIILRDGTIVGWIGGGCVKGIAVKEAQEAIKEGKSRLVRVDPNAQNGSNGTHQIYQMTCHSGGTMELFIEPVMPNPQLIIVGKSNIARALAKVASAANMRVDVMASHADTAMFPQVDTIKDTVDFDQVRLDNNSFIVIATQGEDDEESVRKALLTKCPYVGFIASKRKSGKIKEYLLQAGVSSERTDMLKTPVGIDINAKLPDEIAISILAEIIQEFRNREDTVTEESTEMGNDTYINPVCNIPVSKKEAKHVVEYGGHTVYFCCDGCKVSFDQQPEKYIAVLEAR